MNFLDYIERYKFAIMGTVLFHVGVFIYANFDTIDRPFNNQEPITEVEIPLEDILFDPEVEKLLEINKGDEEVEDVTNVAADANDNREKSYENFSTQELDEQVLNDAKALEKQYFEEWAATHPGEDPSNFIPDNSDNSDNSDDNNNTIDNNSVDTDGDYAAAGTVIASWDLKNRKVHSLRKPGYLCNRAGTVVVQIKVDQNGKVKAASYLAEMSSNATECMIEQAVKYAKKARFNFSSTAPASQTGTITYKFVKK